MELEAPRLYLTVQLALNFTVLWWYFGGASIADGNV